MTSILKQYSKLPGKNINLIFSLSYLSVLVIFPLLFLILSLKNVSFNDFTQALSSKRTLDAFKVSFLMASIASTINLFLGGIIAWVLTKYDFFGRSFFDSLIDLPFAMPTAVSGIALATLYSQDGFLGKFFASFGIYISYTPLGIILALVFIGIPFVIRAVQPAIKALDREMEEAAETLGAPSSKIFQKIILPQLLPSLITGFTMSLARGLGEYGSIIFISGNIPYYTEILPLLIVSELEQFDYKTATILAVTMLFASFILLVLLGIFGSFIKKRYGH